MPIEPAVHVALLTGGGDKPYAIGLSTSLAPRGVALDFIGSDDLDVAEVRTLPDLRFLNLRGDQHSGASLPVKMLRILRYYARLVAYAATARPRVFHILWNNKFELFDRTVLMLWYRLLGKRFVLTVHNVNRAARDGGDGPVNRLTLRVQYRMADHLFVHTEQMRRELASQFGVPASRISTIPFGINNMTPVTGLTQAEARTRLGIDGDARVALVFGNIAPYKGLEFAVEAMARLVTTHPDARLLIAGQPKHGDGYWSEVRSLVRARGLENAVLEHIRHVPDEEVELYFTSADVLLLPYTHVFQSGVLFLGYNFGLPAIVTDVGSLKDDVLEGVTGYVCAPRDAESLAAALRHYFDSELCRNLEAHRAGIRHTMSARHSWDHVAEQTCRVYRSLMGV